MNIRFFFNHREYIEKAIKLIAKAKYRDMAKKKEKRNRLRETEKKN
jgi:hypothetical protein